MQTSKFTYVQLSAQEEKAGQIFSPIQLSVLKNMLADIAHQKINLEFTPNDVLGYAQSEAFLKGQLETVQFLIDTSETLTSVQSIEE